MELVNGWCSKCAAVVAFEQPECADHVDDCPELICCLCGAAYFGELVGYDAAVRTTPVSAAVTPAA